jgi:DNA-binding transcriptional regulator YiaG
MYHYTQCGLENVWLENGYKEKKTPYGKAVAIEDADGLHKVLALGLIEKNGRITGKELKFLRVVMGLSQDGLGKLLGVGEQSVSLWERTGKVPQSADSLTRMLISDKLDGNCKVTDVIERINTVERMINQRIVARETRHKWTSKVAAAEDDRFALAA